MEDISLKVLGQSIAFVLLSILENVRIICKCSLRNVT